MVRDLNVPPPQRLHIDGPDGRLAATYELPEGEPRGAVLHLHPHPEHGGTRQNNVVRHGALGSLEAGCAALRIDFRGAGGSEGSYADGVGEIDDAEAAFRWLQQKHQGLPIYVWGFSFGSRVGLEFGIRVRDEIAGYLAVAWPTHYYEWPEERPFPAPAAFLAGTSDHFVDFDKMGPAEEAGEITLLDGAGHFFPGRLDEVRGWTAEMLKRWLPSL